jgi:hypothetical protein
MDSAAPAKPIEVRMGGFVPAPRRERLLPKMASCSKAFLSRSSLQFAAQAQLVQK